jgi:hypothetical protein
MGSFLTTSSVLQCPHGGSVSAMTTNTVTKAGGAFVVTQSDTFTIAGCPFTLPGGVPSPCVTVQWITSSLSSTVQSNNALTTESQGLCLAGSRAPQGTVLVSTTQTQVSGT